MKKKFLCAAGAILLSAAVSTFVYVNNEKKATIKLLSSNIEALAEIEDDE